MKYKIFISLIALLVSIAGKSQYVAYDFYYYGDARAEIDGQADVFDIQIPTGTELISGDIVVYHPNLCFTGDINSQITNGADVICNSSNLDGAIMYDSNGNEYTYYTIVEDQTSDFFVQLDYEAETEVDLSQGFSSTTLFPTGITSEFTMPTANIQSYDSDIISKAQSLTDGCATMQEAVEKIEKWVVGNISYASSVTEDNSDEDASEVFERKTGNCAGYVNVMIALLRSVNIPARFVSGVAMPYSFQMPIQGSSHNWGTMSGLHAVYEVYYPDKGWIMGDPQRTVHFVSTHFVRFGHGADDCDLLASVSNLKIPLGDSPPVIHYLSMCGDVTYFGNSYDFDSFSVFQSTNSGKYLYSVAPYFVTGIFDEAEIASGSDLFKSGESVSYIADFTSGTGSTYPVSWDWNIQLYHSGGTYTLASQNEGASLWGTRTEPLLPSYDWLIDPAGNIYGEVSATATVNDGDIVGATIPVSVEECMELYVSNQTYSANTTKNGCYITLEDVVVQNNAKLTLDYEMGTMLEKGFSVASGSTLEIY